MNQTAASPNLHGSACRFCGGKLEHSLVDLGVSPPSNFYLRPEDLAGGETFLPLHALVCGGCFLVQLEAFNTPNELFGDYAYFSSYSDGWVKHAERYVADMTSRLKLGAESQVVEIASNDGYLLQFFVERSIPALGIEPAANVARVAMDKGIPTRVNFFGTETARRLADEGIGADLLLGNNVLAHVPDLNDFVAGLKILLKPAGTVTMEFPHLLELMRENQFDTIYHEHFSYFSLLTVRKVFAAHGLRLFDVERLPTHGGSLRIFACHADSRRRDSKAVAALAKEESRAGLDTLAAYGNFASRVAETKRRLLMFLTGAKMDGKTVVGYGAPAKGNTLLNYCGVRTDFLDYTVDRSPHKQGLFLPGTRIPIHAPERLKETRPDYVLILPWNLKDEIMTAHAYIRDWGGRFVTPIPQVQVHE